MDHYIVAMIRHEDQRYRTPKSFEQTIVPLMTGKMYKLEQAEARAKEMNETCFPELKVLDYTRFVAYSTISE